jgi:hypothetical protein
MKAFTGFTHRERTPVGVVLLIAAAVLVMWLATSAEAASPAASGLLGALGSTVGPTGRCLSPKEWSPSSLESDQQCNQPPSQRSCRRPFVPSEGPQWFNRVR